MIARRRIHQVAKEFNLSNELLIAYLVKFGYDIRGPMSQVTDEMYEKIRKGYTKAYGIINDDFDKRWRELRLKSRSQTPDQDANGNSSSQESNIPAQRLLSTNEFQDGTPSFSNIAPFDAYMGEDPYIFVSYSHHDQEVVYPEIKRLHIAGYRIWYDEGIKPGKDWTQEIAEALNKASKFIVFISPNSIKSKHVIREIHFAIEEVNVDFLAIHIADVELPIKMKFQIGSLHAIFKYKMADEQYFKLLESSLSPKLRTK